MNSKGEVVVKTGKTFGPGFSLEPAPPLWLRPEGFDVAPESGLVRLVGSSCLQPVSTNRPLLEERAKPGSELGAVVEQWIACEPSGFRLGSIAPILCAAMLAASGCQAALPAMVNGGLNGSPVAGSATQGLVAAPRLTVDIDTLAGGGTDAADGATAANASFAAPVGVAYGKGGTFVVDTARNVVRQIDLTGAVRTLAGNGQAGYDGDGPSATARSLSAPTRVAVSSNGNVFFSDTGNHLVRCWDPTDRLLTILGGGTTAPSTASVAGTEVALQTPTGLSFGPDGSLYVADPGLHEVLDYTTDGHVAVFAGTGVAGTTGDGGPATRARFVAPVDVAVSGSGQVAVADAGTETIRQIAPDGTIRTIAGAAGAGAAGDGGPATQAHFAGLAGISYGRDGALYVADSGHSCVRRIGTDGTIYTVAGTGTAGFDGDAAMTASQAQLSNPQAVVGTSDGRVLIADAGNDRIRELTFQ